MPRLHPNFLLLLISTTLSLFLAEMVLRAVESSSSWKRKLYQPGRLLQSPAWIHDPHAGARFTPGWSGVFSFHPDWDPVPVQSNRWGFRFPDYPKEKPAEVRRVALLGDSLTAGLQVASESHYRTLLEAKLSRETPAQVLNFGIPGTGPVAHLGVYLNFARDFEPDTVVLGIYTPNDFFDDSGIRWKSADGQWIERPFADAPGNFRKVLKANSALANAIWSLTWKRAQQRSSPHPLPHPAPDEAVIHADLAPSALAGVSSGEYENKLAVWRDLIEALRTESISCLVVIFPEQATQNESGSWALSAERRQLHNYLRRELEALGAVVITGTDLLDHHSRLRGSTPWAKIGDYLSEAGHLSLAEALADRLSPALPAAD